MKNTLLLLATILLLGILSHAQNIAINNDGSEPDPSAALDVKASDKGVLIPRVDFSNLPLSPATGLLVYVTANGPDGNDAFYYYDGSQWQKLSGAAGLENFTESNYTYDTKTGVKVLATNAATDVDFVIQPKGNGAIIANQPDGAATGGNTRGIYAIDLQTFRSNASKVASGNYSTLIGGYENTASGKAALAIGNDNTASGDHSTTIGSRLTGSSSYEVVVGRLNTLYTPISSTDWEDADRLFVVGNGSSVSSRSNAFTILKNANTTIGGSLTINGNGTNTGFTFTTGRGTDGQVLTSDGSGNTSWATPYSGLTNFTESNYTFDSKYGVKFTPSSAQTNVDFVIIPKGTGAILAHQPDGTSAGGNNRGNYAVDFQTNRLYDVEVASGLSSVISGGSSNTASGEFSFVGGGWSNTASGIKSFVGGGYDNTSSNDYTTVGGGFYNNASAVYSTIAGGHNNSTIGDKSFVGGGYANTASGLISTVAGGSENIASGDLSFVGGGWSNLANGEKSFIGCGHDNTASAAYSAISGGSTNIASGELSFVGAGWSNLASGEKSFVGGGHDNTASAAFSAISGGSTNNASGILSFVCGGFSNTSSGNKSFVGGGEGNTAQSYGEVVFGVFATVGAGDNDNYVVGDRLFVVGNGTANGSRSNAFTILKNANTTIGGSLTINGNGTDASVTFPTDRGTNGQILVTNGSGSTSWATPPMTYSVGDFAQGGIVFWVDETGQHGLVAATADQSTGIQWWNGTYRYTGTTGDGLYAGAMNTTMIVATQMADNQLGNFAAKVCADYSVTVGGVTYGDWYLPSNYELNLLYFQKAVVGGFASSNYWSSTEGSSSGAWKQGFSFGDQYNYNKGNTGYVRAIRAF